MRTSPRYLHRCVAALITFFSVAGIATPLLQHNVQSPQDAVLVRRQNLNESVPDTYPILGLTRYGVQPRLEIRQLEQNADQWNIFILGLQRMMQANESDMLSHYGVASVHGRPYQPWDNISSAPGNELGPGYCIHTSSNFLPWHRPYVTLYEQVLYQNIIQVVNSFTSPALRYRYARASYQWRLPYWDWAADPPEGQSTLPTSMSSSTINVTATNGSVTTITNPLYAYRFHPNAPVDAFYWWPWNQWTTTIRGPSTMGPDAVSQDDVVAATIDNSQPTLKSRLYNLLTNYQNYTQFSNQALLNHDAQHSDSLEKLHNVIHEQVGSGGTMTYLEFSAHDPVFFLHHAFVDRVFAMWQTLYPDSYVEPMAAVEPSFTIEVGWIQDANSPLYPFSSSTSSSWYTANNIRDWTVFGYTYSEFLNNANASSIRAAINTLYGNSASNSSITKRSADPIQDVSTEYIANIVTDKMSVNGSYSTYIFLGDFDASNPSCWPTSTNLAGVDSVFSGLQSAKTHDEPHVPVLVSGTVPLTSMLLRKVDSGELCSMGSADVEAYLIDNLHWRVAKGDGTEVPLEQLSDLHITVVSNEVQAPCAENEFPVWGQVRELPHITQGKVGGCA